MLVPMVLEKSEMVEQGSGTSFSEPKNRNGTGGHSPDFICHETRIAITNLLMGKASLLVLLDLRSSRSNVAAHSAHATFSSQNSLADVGRLQLRLLNRVAHAGCTFAMELFSILSLTDCCATLC
eukprot:s393_g33.t2